MESLEFIFENNSFLFNNVIYDQRIGTAMGQIFAPPYTCLVIAFLEEEKLFKTELQKNFISDDILKIVQIYKRYMDDGSTLLPESVDRKTLLPCLNNLHASIVFTLEPAKVVKQEDIQKTYRR